MPTFVRLAVVDSGSLGRNGRPSKARITKGPITATDRGILSAAVKLVQSFHTRDLTAKPETAKTLNFLAKTRNLLRSKLHERLKECLLDFQTFSARWGMSQPPFEAKRVPFRPKPSAGLGQQLAHFHAFEGPDTCTSNPIMGEVPLRS